MDYIQLLVEDKKDKDDLKLPTITFCTFHVKNMIRFLDEIIAEQVMMADLPLYIFPNKNLEDIPISDDQASTKNVPIFLPGVIYKKVDLSSNRLTFNSIAPLFTAASISSLNLRYNFL